MSTPSTLESWENEGGAVDNRPGVVMIIPRSEYERNDPDMQGLIEDMRRERVRIEIVADRYWEEYKRLLEIDI